MAKALLASGGRKQRKRIIIAANVNFENAQDKKNKTGQEESQSRRMKESETEHEGSTYIEW